MTPLRPLRRPAARSKCPPSPSAWGKCCHTAPIMLALLVRTLNASRVAGTGFCSAAAAAAVQLLLLLLLLVPLLSLLLGTKATKRLFCKPYCSRGTLSCVTVGVPVRVSAGEGFGEDKSTGISPDAGAGAGVGWTESGILCCSSSCLWGCCTDDGGRQEKHAWLAGFTT